MYRCMKFHCKSIYEKKYSVKKATDYELASEAARTMRKRVTS